MQRTTALLLTAAAVAALAGCSSRTEPGTAEPVRKAQPELPAVESPTTTTPAAPKGNTRGLIPKKLGEIAGLGDTADAALVTFAVDSVKVDPPCDEYGSKPEGGHTLMLKVRVSTTSDLEAAQALSYLLNYSSFLEVGKDGVTRAAQPGMCIDSSRYLPYEFGVNQKYTGLIELVVPQASGIIAIQDPMSPGETHGWEWSY